MTQIVIKFTNKKFLLKKGNIVTTVELSHIFQLGVDVWSSFLCLKSQFPRP